MKGELELRIQEQNFLRTLVQFGVSYLVIGGHAARYYGVNRAPSDMDIVIAGWSTQNDLRKHCKPSVSRVQT